MKKEATKIKKTNRKRRIAKVVSKKTAKTAVVEIERLVKHPFYSKRYTRHSRISVHDEKEVKKGDKVEIEECRPISKTKSWKIISVVK